MAVVVNRPEMSLKAFFEDPTAAGMQLPTISF